MMNIPIIALYVLFVLNLLIPQNPITYDKNKIFNISLSSYSIITVIIIIFIILTMNSTDIKFLPKNDFNQITRSYSDYVNNIEVNKMNIRKSYGNFSGLAQYIYHNEKTDIIPFDISLLYGYGLNWQPRPVIQSYTNYTPVLDKITAKHFLTEKAPDKLIYSPITIDDRYSLFDEPETFRTILLEYSAGEYNDSYLILKKNQQINSRNMGEISNLTAKTGEIINIPFHEDAYVFMEVDLDFNIFGKLTNFFFKTENANIELNLLNKSKKKYRFLNRNGKNKLFVSKYISNTEELKQIFDENFIPDIISIRILGNYLFYNKNIKVRFYSIPITNMAPIINIPLPQDISDVVVNDMNKISKLDDVLVLYCGNIDPLIHLPLKEPIDKPSDDILLQIRFSNSKEGTIQFFYDFGNNYSESNSYFTKLEVSPIITMLRVPIIKWETGTKLFSVRIDPPNDTKFELYSIDLYGKN